MTRQDPESSWSRTSSWKSAQDSSNNKMCRSSFMLTSNQMCVMGRSPLALCFAGEKHNLFLFWYLILLEWCYRSREQEAGKGIKEGTFLLQTHRVPPLLCWWSLICVWHWCEEAWAAGSPFWYFSTWLWFVCLFTFLLKNSQCEHWQLGHWAFTQQGTLTLKSSLANLFTY